MNTTELELSQTAGWGGELAQPFQNALGRYIPEACYWDIWAAACTPLHCELVAFAAVGPVSPLFSGCLGRGLIPLLSSEPSSPLTPTLNLTATGTSLRSHLPRFPTFCFRF